MSQRARTRLLIAGLIAVIAGTVWFGAQGARDASRRGDAQVTAANGLLTSRLDMETGLRGFLLTGQEQFLQPYLAGDHEFRIALAAARRDTSGAEAGRLLDVQQVLTRGWIDAAQAAIAARREGHLPSPQSLIRRKAVMDQFRRANAQFKSVAAQAREDSESRSTTILIGLVALIGLIAAGVGYLAIERPARRAKQWRREQAEFSDALQFSSSEQEAQDLVRRRLERIAPGSEAVVLMSNNSENRLIAATELDPDGDLANRLPTAAPSTCLAVRRGHDHARSPDLNPLQECELCGEFATNSICMPTLVGGEVIGSVIVGGSHRIKPNAAQQLNETMDASAPVLGNLRNLAIAETRAVTDSLTGLANSRSAADTLERMAAFAGRTGTPLSAILFDLDHFKHVNDNFGHQIGDEVLAATGRTISGAVRASDFCARYGGEEFLVLCQDTDRDEAVEVAEKLRAGISALHVAGYTGRVTASFGVAAIPRNAGDPDALLRTADEALYAAKEAGRDRVLAANGDGPTIESRPDIAGNGAPDSLATVRPAPG